jgi:hypothetical protein
MLARARGHEQLVADADSETKSLGPSYGRQHQMRAILCATML